MTREVGRTDDGRWIVVDGRRWRAADPALPDDVRARLLHHLGVARAAVRGAGRSDDPVALAAARARVQLAKTGLGERGEVWWEQDDDARRARWEAALRELDADR
ncbi:MULTISPECIES: biopolymer transporter Tol [unclassified Blastococcus]